jgi:hypothetical protein
MLLHRAKDGSQDPDFLADIWQISTKETKKPISPKNLLMDEYKLNLGTVLCEGFRQLHHGCEELNVKGCMCSGGLSRQGWPADDT